MLVFLVKFQVVYLLCCTSRTSKNSLLPKYTIFNILESNMPALKLFILDENLNKSLNTVTTSYFLQMIKGSTIAMTIIL